MSRGYGVSINGWFMSKMLIAFALVMSLALAAIGYQNLMIEALEAKQLVDANKITAVQNVRDELVISLQQSEASINKLNKDLLHREAVLAARDEALKINQKELAELSSTLRGLRKTNEKFKTWSDAHVPDAVIRLLRQTRYKSNNQNDNKEAISTNKPDTGLPIAIDPGIG